MTLIMGSNGSMGTRYKAIFDYIKAPYLLTDLGDELADAKKLTADRFLVCTPTDTHFEILKKLIPYGKPILCEKPITKNLDELLEIISQCKHYHTPFAMVLQYSELTYSNFTGESYYDYFRTGKDGLKWDCFQIIALAKGTVTINNKSPFWTCEINGQTLYLNTMDDAYYTFILKWLGNELNQDHEEIFMMHKKVSEYGS